MKFSCDRCQTRYSIGDEKVRGKVLKIRCKTCGNIIVVREQNEGAAALAAQSAPSMAASATTGLTTGVLPPTPASPPRSATPAARAGRDVEWYVAIKGKQHGPCKKDEVARLYREAKITERTYLWNETMTAWTRLKDVPQFAALLAEPPAQRRPPPPPPPSEEGHAGAEIIPFDEVKRARDNATGVTASLPGAVNALQNDPFAAVSQPGLGGDQAPRDSTRVFIMQAGLANRGKKHRAYAYAAAAVLLVLGGVCALDYENIIEIPGLHSVVAAVAQKAEPKKVVQPGAAWDDTEEDPKLKCKLMPDYDECVKKVVAANAHRRALKAKNIDIDSGFAVGAVGGGSGSLHKGDGAADGLQAVGGLSDADRAALLALHADTKRAATVKLRPVADQAPTIDGEALDPKNVASVVKQNEPAIQDCIERAAKTGSVPHGKQWLVVSVEPNGRVSNARFKDAVTQQSDAGSCIARSARKWKFAAFPGPPTDAEIPLILSLN